MGSTAPPSMETAEPARAGGAEGYEGDSTTLVSFGSGSFAYSVKCPGEASGDHNIVLTTAGVELKYRLIY